MTNLIRYGRSFLALLLSIVSVPALGDEAWIKEWLSKPIVPQELSQAEVERFCEARIVRLPVISQREEWQAYARRLREEMLTKVVLRGEAQKWSELPTQIEWLETMDGGEGYRIKKLRYEAVPGLWIPALLYEPTSLSGKVPVVMNVNGHDGKGKAADYKQIRCINQAKRGMLALNVEWLGMGQLRGDGYVHYRMNQLDLCGTSGLAPFYLSMKRGLDVLLQHKHADPQRVAVAGLSGGGWQTIYISSLDERVTLSNPVAGYSSFITRVHNHSDLGDSEQTPSDMATVADYAHLTALLAPRPALLTYNVKDNCCFASGHALPPLLDAARPIYELFNRASHLRSHVNHDPGTHNFERDNREALYRMFAEHFLSDSPQASATEIDSQMEVKTADQLLVDVPQENATFHSLALQLSRDLPRTQVPEEASQREAWGNAQRRELRALLNLHDYEVMAEKVGSEVRDGVTVNQWKLRVSDLWSVPAVEFVPAEPQAAVLLVGDEGRAALSSRVQDLLHQRKQVVVIEPFYIGEGKPKSRPFLFALLVAAVGDRTAGLQASQLAAAARWMKALQPEREVQLVAVGERTGLSAMVAAAVETDAIDAVRLHGSLDSLRQVIEKNYAVDQKPEFFAFGLLEKFDLQHFRALIAPRPCDATKEESQGESGK